MQIETILQWYEEHGYPFTKISVATAAFHSDTLFIAFDITEGPCVYIEKIEFTGNVITKEYVLQRTCGIARGDLYNQKKIENIPHRLQLLQFLSSVEQPQFFINGNGGVISCNIHEGKMNSFDGVLGFIPSTTSSTYFFSGAVNISLHNLFGTNRKAYIHWMRENVASHETSLQYNEPWLFEYPIFFQGNFYQRKQDSLFVTTSFSFSPSYQLEQFTLGTTLIFENVTPAIINSFTLYSSTTYFGIDAMYDSRNDVFSPTTGYLFRIASQRGEKRVPAQHSTSIRQKFFSDFELYVPTFSQQVLTFAFHTKDISGKALDLSDVFRFGGLKTIRGYHENIFLATRLALTTFEYRFLFSHTASFFPFVDAAYFSLPKIHLFNSSQSERWKTGYGIGFRLQTTIGNIATSFAFGDGNSFSQAKIHFGFTARF